MNDNTQAAESLRDLLDDDGENRAVRAFLMLYGCGKPTAEQMAEHMKRSGFNVVPYWVERSPGHLTKGGAQLWLRMLFDLEKAATPQQDEPPVKDHEIREAVSALTKIAKTYHAQQQLRERIAQVVLPLMERAGWKPPAERFKAEPPAVANRGADLRVVGLSAPTLKDLAGLINATERQGAAGAEDEAPR